MLIPWNTDAPIYYFPWATIGLIVANVLVYFGEVAATPEEIVPWMLVFGDGLHPLQWISNCFLHSGILHLLGNMVFLWAFGLVVEGKLGWQRFLPLYFGICVCYSLIVQVIMLGSFGAALGASGAIYGLLAICMIWAPRNEFSCILLVGRFPTFDVPILGFALLYILLQLGLAFWGSFAMSSEVLHLIGAGVGTVVGIVTVKKDLVDCEGWDLLTVWAGREGEKREGPQPTIEPPKELPPERLTEALSQICIYLQQKNSAAALALHNKMAEVAPRWQLPEPELLALIKLLQTEKQWQASIPPTVQYLRQFPDKSAPMRLKLGQILLVYEHRPAKALEVLGKIPAAALSPEQTELRSKLETEARRQLEDADLEIESEEW